MIIYKNSKVGFLFLTFGLIILSLFACKAKSNSNLDSDSSQYNFLQLSLKVKLERSYLENNYQLIREGFVQKNSKSQNNYTVKLECSSSELNDLIGQLKSDPNVFNIKRVETELERPTNLQNQSKGTAKPGK